MSQHDELACSEISKQRQIKTLLGSLTPYNDLKKKRVSCIHSLPETQALNVTSNHLPLLHLECEIPTPPLPASSAGSQQLTIFWKDVKPLGSVDRKQIIRDGPWSSQPHPTSCLCLLSPRCEQAAPAYNYSLLPCFPRHNKVVSSK